MNFTSVEKIYFTDISIPTGVNENRPLFEGLKIYPNPTIGIITFEFTQNSGKEAEVLVTNLIGAEVFRKEITCSANYQVDLSNQEGGIYILKVYVGNQDQKYYSKIVYKKQ